MHVAAGVWYQVGIKERAVTGPQFRDRRTTLAEREYVSAVSSERLRIVGSKSPQDLAVSRSYFAKCIVELISHPHTGAIESHGIGTIAHGEGAEVGAIAGPQFGNRVVVLVSRPDVGTIECDATRTRAGIKAAEQHAVSRAQLANLVNREAVIRCPNVRSVERQRPCAVGDGEGFDCLE